MSQNLKSEAVAVTKSNPRIGFIGCGNMASAIIKGMVRSGFNANRILVSNRSIEKLEKIQTDTAVSITQNNQQVCENSDVIMLAIKPQMFETVCKPLSKVNMENKLVISVAAGVNTSRITNLFEQDFAVIRAMPNTPSMISEGATGLFANTLCSHEDKNIATKIFQSVGNFAWVKDEDQINTVTAIAGSSPAYIYLFMQAMIDQAMTLGLDAESARTLVTQSLLGTAKLAQAHTDTPLSDLREAVTSPGGTTFEAIHSLNNNNFSEIVKDAVKAAYNRGVNLGEDS
ncbi:MAG: pyrroline-5-carboxylate reductase [Kangiellaceae bacterium]